MRLPLDAKLVYIHVHWSDIGKLKCRAEHTHPHPLHTYITMTSLTRYSVISLKTTFALARKEDFNVRVIWCIEGIIEVDEFRNKWKEHLCWMANNRIPKNVYNY